MDEGFKIGLDVKKKTGKLKLKILTIIVCLNWQGSSYTLFYFPLQESSRNLKPSLFRTQRLWLASLSCAIVLKLLPDHSQCQASTTIKQVSVVWAQIKQTDARSEEGRGNVVCANQHDDSICFSSFLIKRIINNPVC